MRKFSFEVPSVPTRALSPNASNRMHWGHKKEARDQMAHDWGYAIKAAWPLFNYYAFDGDVRCTITVLWPPRRTGMDTDNLIACFKKGLDQLQEQGIVFDDKQLTDIIVRQGKDPEKIGKVVVELTGE